MEHSIRCPRLNYFFGGDETWDRSRPKLHEGVIWRWVERFWQPIYNDYEITYLCVCQFGHCRSVAMARALQKRKINAISAGWSNSGPVFHKLCRLADWIVVMEDCYLSRIPKEDRGRVKVVNVGPDKWVNPFHKDLNVLIDKLAPKAGLWEEGK